MHELILNDRVIQTERSPAQTLLDFVRYEQRLTGTKIGCREGDCGACAVLVGTLEDGGMHYRSVTSCIAPLGNAFGKHVVTIDGLNMAQLSQVQCALVEEGGTQCGFCTPGFVVSLTGYCLCAGSPDLAGAIASVDGNICRCTGYKSIERSVGRVVEALRKLENGGIEPLVTNGFLPEYFLGIPDQLKAMNQKRLRRSWGALMVGGGTDLYVQRPEEMEAETIELAANRKMTGIEVKNGTCRIGAGATVNDLLESTAVHALFPKLKKDLKLIASTPIRNMGTIGGNLVNASPIGDLTIFFLALDSLLVLGNQKGRRRTLALREFYLGYKHLAKQPEEAVEAVEFQVPGDHSHFNFEKVSKRTYLDIASVNTALSISVEGDRIGQVNLSAGGVAPIPMFLRKTCGELAGKPLSPQTIIAASKTVQTEISPISDARGSAAYKSLLLRQLFFAHFCELFPGRISLSQLL